MKLPFVDRPVDRTRRRWTRRATGMALALILGASLTVAAQPPEPPPAPSPDQPPAAQQAPDAPAAPAKGPAAAPAQPPAPSPQQAPASPPVPQPTPTPRPTSEARPEAPETGTAAQPAPTRTPAPTGDPAASEATPPEAPAAPAADADPFRCGDRPNRPIFKLGQDHLVRVDDSVRELVVVFGSARVEGEVCGDLVAVLGNVELGSQAYVRGSMTVVGGTLTVEGPAEVEGDLVVVGGAIDAPPNFSPGRDQVLVGIPVIGDRLLGIVPWLTRGLVYGRLIVPDLAWNWWVVVITLFVSLMLNLLFPRATGLATGVTQSRPLSAFAAGLLVLLLSGPFVTLLAISVIGTAVIPFVMLGMFAAWVVGSIAVARWIGASVIRQDDPDDRLASTRSLLIGFAVKVVAYMIPLVGLTVWALAGVLGLGAATMAFIGAFRAENPRRTPKVPPVPPVPPTPLTSGPAGYADTYGPPPPPPYDAPAGDEALPAGDTETPASDPSSPPTGDAGPRQAPPPARPPGSAPSSFDLRRFQRGGLWERLGAFVLDAILVALFTDAIGLDDRDGAYILLLLAYHVAFWTWKGTTLGGLVLRLRLVKVDGRPLAFTDALVRGLTGIFSIGAAGIGFLWMLRDEQRQTWHDLVAGTLVVRVPAGWPLP